MGLASIESEQENSDMDDRTEGPEKRPHSILGFSHRYVPPETPERRETKTQYTLLLLHGTGGDENDLIPLGRELAPTAALLGVKGKVMEKGMPRFFRRFGEGVFDVEDLKARTWELAEFVALASSHYGFERDSVVAVGYSNGANIAASMLLLLPRVLRGALLFRATVPLVPDSLPDLSRIPVFLSAGMFDPIVPRTQVEELARLLQKSRAQVPINWEQAGHSMTRGEPSKARTFFQQSFDPPIS